MCAGVRILVGSSAARHTPVAASLGSRTSSPVALPAYAAKRWHVLRMTAAEALAAAPDTHLQVGLNPKP